MMEPVEKSSMLALLEELEVEERQRKEKERKQREIRKSRRYTENLRHSPIIASARREEGKRRGRRSETEVVTESIHKFTTTFHLPDFCQLSFLSSMYHFILFGYISDTYPLAFLYKFLLSIS